MSKRREFLLLADTFNAEKHDPIGMIASEKLDGNRCFWDGGVTRGVDTLQVPWASIHHPKTGEIKDKIKPVATGLWSRYGNPVQAPDWFLDQLPPEPLDGELYAGRGNFQLTQTIVRRDDPNAGDWTKIKFIAFAAPTFGTVFQSGLIKNANFLREIDMNECLEYIWDKSSANKIVDDPRCYTEELDVLDELKLTYDNNVFDVVATALVDRMEVLDRLLKNVVDLGGEGVMLRDPDSVWFPKRRPFLLKVKPRPDAECEVIGFVAGRKGKTGQFLGKLGTLICQWTGDPTAPCGKLKEPVIFEIGTGLTHQDRELYTQDEPNARANPGKQLSGLVKATPHFKVGDRVTFSYMGLSNTNVPREPAYLRKRESEQ